MNREVLISLLDEPDSLKNFNIKELEDVVLEHPYALVLRMLLLRKIQELKGSLSQVEVDLARIYAPNLQKFQVFIEK